MGLEKNGQLVTKLVKGKEERSVHNTWASLTLFRMKVLLPEDLSPTFLCPVFSDLTRYLEILDC